MNHSKPTTLAAAALAAGLFLLPASRLRAQTPGGTPSVSAPAQPAPGDRQEGGGNRDDFRQRMAERIKAGLKASDDEWTVIQPLLEKVVEKQAATRGGGFGGPGGNRGDFRRGNGGNGGNGGNQQAGGNQQQADNNQAGGNNRRREGGGPRGGSPESQALMAALADDNSTVNDVKAKLQAVRDQRKQAATELAQAREELRKVLNMRQEAAMVVYGILD